MNLIRIAIAGIAALALATNAAAQCPQFSDAFHEPGFDSYVEALAEFDDGSGPAIYAGGFFTHASGGEARYIARWNGSRWEALPASPNGRVQALHVWDDGHGPALYVGGIFSAVGTTPATNWARWDGQSWTSLPAVNGQIFDFEVYDDGSGEKLYIAGGFLFAGGVFSPGVARWDGASVASFGGVHGDSNTARALTVFDDGTGSALYVGGSFDNAGNVNGVGNIARFGPMGWSALGSGANESVDALTAHVESGVPVLVAGGLFTAIGGVSANRIARWQGSSWSPVGLGVSTGFDVRALASFDDGSGSALWAGGYFSAVGNVAGTAGVARWNGSAWQSAGGGFCDSPCLSTPFTNAFVVHDDGTGAKLCAAGGIDQSGTSHLKNFGVWNGSSWNAPGTELGIDGSKVEALTTFDDGTGSALYVGGAFHAAGDQATNSIARFDGTRWTAISTGANGVVHALCTYDDGDGPRLYAGGEFTSIGGVSACSIARWDGVAWQALASQPGVTMIGCGSSPVALIAHDDGSGPALYVAHGFVFSGLTGANRIARWRNGTWSALDQGLPGGVTALAIHDDGAGPKLYAGGPIATPGSPPYYGVKMWNGSTWLDLGATLPNTGFNPTVTSLCSFDNGTGPVLYAAIREYSTAPSPGLVRLVGGVWSVTGSIEAWVESLATHDDGTGAGTALYVGGTGQLLRHDGASFTQLSTGISGPGAYLGVVHAFASWDDGSGRDLYIGGSFDRAGGFVSTNIARWEGCGESGRTFCFGDGGATACPCGNSSAVGARAGCSNSLGTAGALRGRGEASLSTDTFALDGSGMTNTSALYFQGANLTNGGAGVAFGDGIKCTNGPFVRLATKANAAGASTYPASGDASVSVRGLVGAPGVRRYQVRYRNVASFCTPEPFNYTNGVEVVWGP